METITRQRATETAGRLDDVVLDWSDPDEADIDGVAVAPKPSTEANDNRTAVLTDLVLYLPAGADVLPADRLVVRGATYEAIGDVADWRNPFTGANPGGELTVRKVDG